MRQLDD